MTNEILELITESYEVGNITLEEANELVNKISNSNAGKGVNRTYINATKTLAKEYKEAKKKIKKHISGKEFDKARESINDARAQLKELKEYINGLPREIKDDVLSYAVPALTTALGASAGLFAKAQFNAAKYSDCEPDKTANPGTSLALGLLSGAVTAGTSAGKAYAQGKDINKFKQQLDASIKKEEKMLDRMEKLLTKKENK